MSQDVQLRCNTCGHTHEPEHVAVETTARFEGASSPDDQAIVFGFRCEVCGLRGVPVAAYGPTASVEETTVVTGLPSPRRPPP